jgi:hypothetical protein
MQILEMKYVYDTPKEAREHRTEMRKDGFEFLSQMVIYDRLISEPKWIGQYYNQKIPKLKIMRRGDGCEI